MHNRSVITLTIFAVLFLSTVIAGAVVQTGTSPSVYGYVKKVVLEPNAEKPDHAQIWGTFCTAVPNSAEFQAPERGYLYLRFGADSKAAVSELNQLYDLVGLGNPQINSVGTVIYGGIISFGGAGTVLRVRTSDETPKDPDLYVAGAGVKQVAYMGPSPAVQMLGKLPLPPSHYNYVRVEKVVLDSNSGAERAIQIWGTFELANDDSYSFSSPQQGYVYVRSPGSPIENEWQSAAESHRVVGFHVANHQAANFRVRQADEAPAKPDDYVLRTDQSPIRPDTTYVPLKLLLKDFR